MQGVGLADLHCPRHGDALDFRKPFRFLLDDAKSVRPEGADDIARRRFPHAANQPAGKVPLDGVLAFRPVHLDVGGQTACRNPDGPP